MVSYDDLLKQKETKEFRKARQRAFWNELWTFLTNRPKHLLAWDQVRDKLGVQSHTDRGIQSVPVKKIIGSVGRYQDFDRAFMPTKDSLSARWHSIARAYYTNETLPPIKLYQAGDVYFVVDGHHRVSVASKKGIEFIDAQVIQVQTRVPVTDTMDASNIDISGEYVRFLEHTDLDKLRPGQPITFTIGGGYTQLLEHIAVHRYAMSHQTQKLVSQQEAVRDWYDREYSPIVQIIRSQDVLSDFPKRTEADLYLWIIEHQYYLRERCSADIIAEQAAQHFANSRTVRPVKRAANALRELFFDPVCEQVTQSTSRANKKTGK